MDAIEKLQSALSDRYRIVREIGAGGMATVYLARDIKHDRHVALKLLRPELGAVLGGERFFSEIKVTAHLQHPHLLPLFDSGEADGLLFYVMPYVEGETLRAKLDKEHQLPVEEALRITLAVASALEYAHKQNVVHRDLKPENILMQHGEPVITDFGIALAVSNAGGARITQTGLSLGTPQYMSPEQATGDREIDARSDIYSLGAILYEMLTGEPPHTGKTAQAIIARVLTEKAQSARVMRDTVPPHVDAAVLKALAKLPADRFTSAGAFAEALTNPAALTLGRTASGAAWTDPALGDSSLERPRTRSRLASWLPWALTVVAASVAAMTLLRAPRPGDAAVGRFPLVPPPAAKFDPVTSPLAVSPDGSLIVFGGAGGAGAPLYVRALSDTLPRSIAGTEGATGVFFSPDSKALGFVTGTKLATVALAGGGPTTLVTGTVGRLASWGPDGNIVFSKGLIGTLWIVPSNGGEPRQLTRPDSSRGEVAHFAPWFLPDGKALLLQSLTVSGEYQLGVATLDGKVRALDLRGRTPRFVLSGHLLYETPGGRVMAAAFDGRTHRLTGPAVPVLENVFIKAAGSLQWDVSPNGTLVTYGGSRLSSIVLVSRTGAAQPVPSESRAFRRPMASPDGSSIVVEMDETGSVGATGHSELWMYRRAAGTLSRLTFTEGSTDPAWARDGKRVAFTMREKGTLERHVYWQLADGSAPPELLYKAPGTQFPFGFSTDGHLLAIDELSTGGAGVHLRTVPLDSGRKEEAVVLPPYVERLSQISRDGRWQAYTSTESGRVEVFVRPFPGPGGKWQVSVGGGDQPLWNPNGRELFYRDGAKVVSATVQTSPTFAVTGRRPLFDDVYLQANTLNWSVMPDGDHFVMIKSLRDDSHLLVTVNWLEELKKRAKSANAK